MKRKIKISVPEEFIKIPQENRVEFVFDYLKRIGFGKSNFRDVIKPDEHDYLNYEFFIDNLPEIDSDISTDIMAGAYYLIHHMDSNLLTEDKLNSIIIELKGGYSIYYYKSQPKGKDKIKAFKQKLEAWIQETLMENDIDPEIKLEEIKIFRDQLNEFSKEMQYNGYDYNVLIRPGCDIQQRLKIIEERMAHLYAKNNT